MSKGITTSKALKRQEKAFHVGQKDIPCYRKCKLELELKQQVHREGLSFPHHCENVQQIKFSSRCLRKVSSRELGLFLCF